MTFFVARWYFPLHAEDSCQLPEAKAPADVRSSRFRPIAATGPASCVTSLLRSYGQPSSSSGLMMTSLRTSSAGAAAIQTIREATSAGGKAFVTGGGSRCETARSVDDHTPQ